MARPLRILYPGAWYHVMNRARSGERLFRDKGDFLGFLEIVKKSMSFGNFRVAAYCLMTNHYHFLIQTLEPNLPRIMRHINGVYTQRFNRKYGKDGTLFRGRYKAILVDRRGYLIDVIRYIHRNPKKAGLENALGEYPWSSHHGYLSKAKKWDWLTRDIAVSNLTWNSGEWKKAYLAFMEEEDNPEILAFYSLKNLRSVLGTSDFIQWVKDRFTDSIYSNHTPRGTGLRCTVDDVIREVSRGFKTTEASLFEKRRGKPNEPRDAAIYLSRRWTEATSIVVAERFRLSSHSGVSEASRRVENQIRKKRGFRDTITKIEAALKVCQLKT